MIRIRNILNGIPYLILPLTCLLFLIFLLLACTDIKPIRTLEEWAAHKEMVKDTLMAIITVVITGLIPSLFGFISYRSMKKRKGSRSKVWLIPIIIGVFLTLGITFLYFRQGHWGWGLLPIPSFIIGLVGVFVTPQEFFKR